MITSAFTEALQHEVTALQATFPDLAEGLSRARALVVGGAVFPEDSGREAMVRSSDGTAWYHVNGSCPCKASEFRQEPCQHRLAFRLYQRVGDRLADDAERWTVGGDPDALDTAPVVLLIPPQYITHLHGKPFVQYTGLLALAHAHGLVSLKVRFLSVTGDLALAEAEARFRDGRVFVEAADATPQNVGATVKAHFARLALTRAKARALRDALNIGMCAIEEVSE